MGKTIDITSKRPWSIVAKSASDLEIFLYSQIGADWFGEGTTAKQFVQDLKDAGDGIKNITLRINSPGGEVFDGLAIYNALLSHPATVTAQIDGIAASIASVIAMAASKVVMAENALMMIHNPQSLVVGDSADMRQMADVMDKVRDSMIIAYNRHAKVNDAQIISLMDAETWMSADEALRDGFATDTMAAEPMAACIAGFDLTKFVHVPASVSDEQRRRKGALSVDLDALQSQVQGIRIAAQAAQNSSSSSANSSAHAGEKTTMENKEATTAAATTVVDNYNEVAAEIIATGIKLGSDQEEVQRLIKAKSSLPAAKDVLYNLYHAQVTDKLAKAGRTSGVAEPTISSLSVAERKSYSVIRLISSMIGDGAATMEREISADIEKAIGRPAKGIYVPTNLNPTKITAALDTKTGGAGGFTVATEVMELIELLRNKMLVRQLGATVLSGLSDNLTFPVRLTGSATSWVSENPGSDVSASDATFGSKTMTPKTLQGTTAISRQLLAQSSVDMENLVRTDLATAHALAIDAAAINGSGLSNQPLGLLKTSGIGNVAIGAAGGAPTYAFIVDLETALASANGDSSSMKFLTTPVMRGKLRKTEQFSTTNGLPVWQQLGNSLGVGDVLGYPAYVSNQVPSTLVKSSSTDCHAIIFGDWSQLLIGEWGVIDLVVDPYSLKKQGLIEVTSFQMVDVLVRQPAMIAAIQDARNV